MGTRIAFVGAGQLYEIFPFPLGIFFRADIGQDDEVVLQVQFHARV